MRNNALSLHRCSLHTIQELPVGSMTIGTPTNIKICPPFVTCLQGRRRPESCLHEAVNIRLKSRKEFQTGARNGRQKHQDLASNAKGRLFSPNFEPPLDASARRD